MELSFEVSAQYTYWMARKAARRARLLSKERGVRPEGLESLP